MKILVIIFTILLCSSSFAQQTFSIKGQAAGPAAENLLQGATIMLLQLPDSAVKAGDITDSRGRFRLTDVRPGSYVLSITYLGFNKLLKDIRILRGDLNLGTIILSPGDVETREIEIVGKVPPAVQKGDTSEYNADAYKISRDASAEDLVTKMPGVTMSEGKVQAHGEEVKKVLVDGREFMGDDPGAVLKNIPAEVVEKIQVFDQQSEQARFTGFDDGNTDKTINIVTRTKIRQGTFGKLTAGYGNEERYKAGGNVNFFNNDRRITLLSQFNNVNEQNFSSEDLLGVMQGSGGGQGRRGGMGMRGGGGPGQGGGRPSGGPGEGPGGGGMQNISNFLVDARTGLSNTNAFGLNYSDKWADKLELTGSYFFNKTSNNTRSELDRTYLLSSLNGQTYNETSTSRSDNINHRLNMRVEYQIDSSNSVLLRPRLSFQQNDGNTGLLGYTNTAPGILNSMNNTYRSNLKALNSSADLLYRHKFNTTGRTMSLQASGSYRDNNGDKDLYSETLYFDNLAFSDTADQTSKLNKYGFTGSSNLVYTEPLGRSGQLQFSARYSYSDEKSDQKTYDIFNMNNMGGLLDTSLSNVYRKIYRSQSYGTGYRYQNAGFFATASINYNIARLQNSQEFPMGVNTEKTFYSYLPSLMIRYRISRDKNLRVFYRTSNTDPSVEQLQNVIDNSNSLQLRSGNPALRQDYSHNFALNYSSVNVQSMNSFFILFGGTFKKDYIGNNTTIAAGDTLIREGLLLRQGSQFTMPVNLDGYVNLRSFMSYSMPVGFLQSNLNMMLNASYSRTPGIVNGSVNYANSNTYGGGVVLSSNISPELDFTVSSNSSYNEIYNSLRKDNNSNYFNQNTRIRFTWQFWKGFLIQNELNHQLDNGRSGGNDRNYLLWNMSLGKKFFSRDQGELRFTVYDVLNENTNLDRTTTDFYYEDTRSNVLGRFFILSFTYNIRI